MKKSTTIAIDLAKNVFEVAVSEEPGRVSERKRLNRGGLISYLAKRPGAVVVMEACGSAHYWGREIEGLRHEVRLLPPSKTTKYRIGDKTDRTDTDALLEANRNEKIQAVPVKTEAQQTLTSVHRIRARWVETRTARLNALRGVLREFGTALPEGAKAVLPGVSEAMARGRIPEELHPLVMELMAEVRKLEENVTTCDRQLERMGRSIPVTKELQEVPGLGPLNATAIVAAAVDARRFKSGRKMASFFGIVPRENSSGNRRRLGSITKRGDSYVRTMVIHGARSLLIAAHRRKKLDRIHRWALEVERQQGRNRAAVAVGNKLIRIAWAIWAKGKSYDGSMGEPEAKKRTAK